MHPNKEYSMKLLPIIAAAAILAAAAPAIAQEAAASQVSASLDNLRKGQLILSAEGRRMGRIESIVRKDGVIAAVRIIKDSRFIAIPVETLSPANRPNVCQTSLAASALR
jgi:hypothetical protein